MMDENQYGFIVIICYQFVHISYFFLHLKEKEMSINFAFIELKSANYTKDKKVKKTQTDKNLGKKDKTSST